MRFTRPYSEIQTIDLSASSMQSVIQKLSDNLKHVGPEYEMLGPLKRRYIGHI